MQPLREAKLKQFAPGATLQNGRICLLYDDNGEHNGVVMGADVNDAMTYATWMVHWVKSGERWFGSTVSGRYFFDFESAYRDYRERRDEVRTLRSFFSRVV